MDATNALVIAAAVDAAKVDAAAASMPLDASTLVLALREATAAAKRENVTVTVVILDPNASIPTRARCKWLSRSTATINGISWLVSHVDNKENMNWRSLDIYENNRKANT